MNENKYGSRGTMRVGPSHAYLRLLVGKLTAARYAQIVMRAVSRSGSRDDA